MIDKYTVMRLKWLLLSVFLDQEEHIKGRNGEEIRPLILWTDHLLDCQDLKFFYFYFRCMTTPTFHSS